MTEFKILRLGDFQEEQARLDPAAFATRHGEAYFLHFGPIGKLKMILHGSDTYVTSEPSAPRGVAFNPRGDYLVFPVRRPPEAPAGEVAFLVGRDPACDVVIPDRSISARHALVVKGEEGTWRLEDTGSSNGTFLEGVRVVNAPFRLDSGARVRLGDVTLSFLDAAGFHLLVGSLLGA